MAALIVVWVVFRRSTNAVHAVLTSAAIAVATGLLLLSPLASTLLGRFGIEGDVSTTARSDALGIGLGLATDEVAVGHGSGFAYTYSSTFLQSSFENAYLATAIDFGLFVAFALVLVQVWAVFSARGTPLLFRIPGLLAIVWGFTYSSFVSSSTFSILSWTFVALAGVAGYRSVPFTASAVRHISRNVPAAARPTSVGTVLGRA